MIQTSTLRVEDPGFDSHFRHRNISVKWEYTSDLEMGTPVVTLSGTWCYRISAGTGWSGVCILWPGDVESLICNFYFSVAARKLVLADLSQSVWHAAGMLSNQVTVPYPVFKVGTTVAPAFQQWLLAVDSFHHPLSSCIIH